MLSVASKLYMLSVVMLNVMGPSHHIIKKATLSITKLSIMGDCFMLSVIYAVCVFMLSVAKKPLMLSVVMLNVVELNVNMLGVVAP
jgi:hypothetical protein